MKFQSNCNCNRLHLHVIDPNSVWGHHVPRFRTKGSLSPRFFTKAKWFLKSKVHLSALGRGQKDKYHLISITKSISKIFLPNFAFVLTNERYKTYQMDFHSVVWVMTLGCWGCPRGQQFIFFKQGHVAYQIDGDDEHNGLQVKLLMVELVTLGQIS